MIGDLFQDEPDVQPIQAQSRTYNRFTSCADEVDLPPLERKAFIGLKNQVSL
jgi:hypothetical protein